MKYLGVRVPALLALVALALVSACSSSPQRGTEVTRFHLGEPIPPQVINIEPTDPAEKDSLSYRNYSAVVASELARTGFVATDTEEVNLVALVAVTQTSRMELPRRSPVSIGIGGAGSNVGVGTSVGLGGTEGGEVMVTELELQLKSRADRQIIWEGKAMRAVEPGTGINQSAVVQRLAAALLSNFPGESGKTFTVE